MIVFSKMASGATARTTLPVCTNEGGSVFAFRRRHALRLFNSDPLAEKLRVSLKAAGVPSGGASVCAVSIASPAAVRLRALRRLCALACGLNACNKQPLGRSNYVAFVAQSDPCVACVYDDLKQRIVLRFCEESRVLGIILAKERFLAFFAASH